MFTAPMLVGQNTHMSVTYQIEQESTGQQVEVSSRCILHNEVTLTALSSKVSSLTIKGVRDSSESGGGEKRSAYWPEHHISYCMFYKLNEVICANRYL